VLAGSEGKRRGMGCACRSRGAVKFVGGMMPRAPGYTARRIRRCSISGLEYGLDQIVTVFVALYVASPTFLLYVSIHICTPNYVYLEWR
jgi:hypothetical protein